MSSSALFSPKKRMILGGTCIFLALILIVGVCTIPFVFESSSIYYKFGIHKTLLRTGKVLGIIAATLIFFQVLLVSRLKILDRIFSLNQMYRCHRMNGMIIAFLTLMHPILILASENFTLFPSEIRYWPELLGAVVWVFIVMLFITAYWRLIFGFAYDKWLRFHRLVTKLSIVSLTIHILFVFSEFTGDVFFDPENIEKSKFNFVVRVDSINTHNGKRDQHLRSDDFFAARKYPVMMFKSSRVSHAGGNKYILEGKMTIRDVTRDMLLEFIYWGQKENPFNEKEMVAGFDSRFNINRLNYHVGNGKFYKMGVVQKDVDVLISLEMVRNK